MAESDAAVRSWVKRLEVQGRIAPENNRVTHEETISFGQAEYQDVIDLLAAQGLSADFIQTGGMNAALLVLLEGGRSLLITRLGWGAVLGPAATTRLGGRPLFRRRRFRGVHRGPRKRRRLAGRCVEPDRDSTVRPFGRRDLKTLPASR
jgi:hypothetical protein